MIILLVIVIGLVVWSLRLMQAAFNYREFSLMLAGTLVAISAAGIIVVYFLIEGYMGYMTDAVRYPHSSWQGSGMLVETSPGALNVAVMSAQEEFEFKPTSVPQSLSLSSSKLSSVSHF
ncbi:MAG TPA: hypothetical protein V6D03_13925 [Candidatus Caenarcaniphilales bacterium]|jgi:flagellar biosynthesis protein FliQ